MIARNTTRLCLGALLLHVSTAQAGGDGCEAVEKAAEAAAEYYVDSHATTIADSNFTPVDDLGTQSCVDEIRQLTMGLTFSIPDIVIQEIIDQVLNAACQAAVTSVNNVKNSVTGDMLSYTMPYGLGRFGVDITSGSGLNVERTGINPTLPTIPTVPGVTIPRP